MAQRKGGGRGGGGGGGGGAEAISHRNHHTGIYLKCVSKACR